MLINSGAIRLDRRLVFTPVDQLFPNGFGGATMGDVSMLAERKE